MSLRTFALLVVVALLGGAGFLLFARAGRAPRAAVPMPAVEATEPTREHAELTPAEAPTPDAVALESGDTPTRTESTSEPVEAERTTDDAERETVLVEVIDGASNAPAGDVEVRYASSKRLPRACPTQALPPSAQHARTDAAGRVRLSVPRAKAVAISATRAGELGEAALPPMDDDARAPRRARIVLRPDWDLPVEVLETTGRPAADVELTASMHVREAAVVAAAHTGDDGRATLAHVGHEFGEATPPSLQLAAKLPFQPPAEMLVERAPPQGEPVRMRLPALGAIEVDVRAADGTPAADHTSVQLCVARPDDEPSAATVDQLTQWTHEGRTAFELLPLGQRFEFLATNGVAHARARLAGPRAAGERVAARVQLVVDATVLHLRAVDAAGAPVSGVLFVELRTDDGLAGSTLSIASYDDGRCEFTLDAPGSRRVARLEAQLSDRSLAGAVELPDPLPLGDVELGDLVLAPAPRIAEGRVIDEGRRPVAQASVQWTPVAEYDGDFAFVPRLDTTDEDGRFSIAGSTPAERVTLDTHRDGLVADQVEVAVGARGVEIVMHVAGGLAGSVRLDPGVVPGWISLALSSATGEPVMTESVKRDGAFAFPFLRAGSYDLTAQVEAKPIAEVRGLTVVAGETTRDPRLQPLDLRGAVHVFELELVPPSPGFRIAGQVLYGAAGSGALDQTLWLQSNRVRLVSASAALDAELRVEGCRIERLAALAPHTRVPLRAGFPVRLVLRPEVSLPAPPLRLGAALSIRGDWSSQGARFFDEHGEVVLFAAEPGALTVGWFVERGTGLDSEMEVLELPVEIVRVVERADEQRFELALTNAALQAALDARR